MSGGQINTQALVRFTSAEISVRFRNLCVQLPRFADCTNAQRIIVLCDESNCISSLQAILDSLIDDIWLPIPRPCISINMSPGAFRRLIDNQERMLSESLTIPSSFRNWPGEHVNLTATALSWQGIPTTLLSRESLGEGGFGRVEKVECEESKRTYALKIIARRVEPGEAREQMKYVKMELGVLRRTRHCHFVRLVTSYTAPQQIGILMSPVAECNLGNYLDDFKPGAAQESMLAGFFGCLASAVAHLHFTWRIRHKDIKPQNILVIAGDRNVLLTDFGMALDWSSSNYTTTKQEKLRSPIYCPPEVDDDKEGRNSFSDVWSLGCVFLEMAAVLKGKNRTAVLDIQTRDGRQIGYRNCLEGIEEAIRKLSVEPSNWGNEPLVWAEKMLKKKKEDRQNSRALRADILRAEGFRGKPFCGPCCKGDTTLDRDDDVEDLNPYLQSLVQTGPGQHSSHSQGSVTTSAPATRSVSAQVYDSNTNQWRGVQLLICPQALENWISAKTAADLALGGSDVGEVKSWRFESHVLTSHRRATITLSVEGKGKSHQSDFWITDAGVATSFELLAGPELTSWLGR